MIENIINFINYTLGNPKFLLFAETSSFCIKAYLFGALLFYNFKVANRTRLIRLLLLILAGAIFTNIAWIVQLLRSMFFPQIEFKVFLFLLRIAWIFSIVQYQSLSLFVENLTEKDLKIKGINLITLIINTSLIIYLFGTSIIFFDINSNAERSPLEMSVIQGIHLYLIFILSLAVYKSFRKIRSDSFPTILKHQLKVFLYFLLMPYIIMDLLQYFPSHHFSLTSVYIPISNYAAVSISTILLTLGIYFCTKKIIGLRFLNLHDHVQTPHTFDFINDFTDVIEELARVTNIKELAHITQSFFKSAFSIPTSRTRLYIRQAGQLQEETDFNDTLNTSLIVENFIILNDSQNSSIMTLLRQNKILIRDEIEFNNFYEEQISQTVILEFLNSINADIFLPIIEKASITAYVIIEKDSRPEKLFNSVERDEMLVFASYLSNLINLLKHRDLERLIQQEKELKEELYSKHQEINQYKESIRSFFKNNKDKKIGIVFYKSNKFVLANQAAKELIDVNPNTQEGHSISQTLKKLVKQIQEYKTSQSIFLKNSEGQRIIFSGVPSLDTNSIIILVYYPELSDIMKSQFDVLKDPSQWDYLLYLETTETGKLINSLIPSSSEQLLNFKIELLKISLSKKATLLSMPTEDLLPTVELLHHISLRQTLHVLKLNAPEKNHEVSLKLFGINPLLSNIEGSEGLLSKLNNVGTIYIENINFLSLETQHHLAEFITYGYYHPLKSEHKIFGNVRIICSTSKNLAVLVQEGRFIAKLFNELSKTSLSFPSLLTLSKEEITQLADGFTEQAIKTESYKNFYELNDKEKDKLNSQRAVSLQEFKNMVHQMLIAKSTKNKIYDETEFDPAYNVTNPELVNAVRLGKKALKDPKILSMLWDKFKNQNKIATLLNVNRSSVNRRLKEYNIS
ncbi:sigma 54-interacting transcriptional regulator [Candidatus Dependentiae bacterium]|nr:sigma 54-interacting transcriptional regulator [Candidatus Dependentiae bacterium]